VLCTALLTDRLSLSDVLELAILWALLTVTLLGEQIMIIQWNPSNVDTLRPRFRKVLEGFHNIELG